MLEIKNWQVYDLEESVIASRNAMRLEMPEYTKEEFEDSLKRAYSIAIALCRMICKHNGSLGRFIIAEAYPIRQVIKKLERITVVKGYQIDFIIDRTLQSLRK